MDPLHHVLEGLQSASTVPSEQAHAIQKVRRCLVTNETCAKWILQTLLQRDLTNKLIILKRDLDEFLRKGLEHTDGGHSPLATVAKLLMLAHLRILEKDADGVRDVMTSCYKFVISSLSNDKCGSEYVEGVQYLLKAADISFVVDIQPEKVEDDEVNSFVTDLSAFQNLSVKGLVALMAVRQYFLQLLGPGFEQQSLELAREMTRLDPGQGEWHYCLYLNLRRLRRSIDLSLTVLKEEQDAIFTATLCSDAKSNPVIWIEYLQCLVEIMRHRAKKKAFALVRLREQEFRTDVEFAAHIRDVADNILAMDATSEVANVAVAKVYSETLPFKHQDKAFAKACLKRALMFNEDSSSVLLELAKFYLSQGFIEKADKRLARALELDKGNFNVILLYIKLLMRSMLHNYERLKEFYQMIDNNAEDYGNPVETDPEFMVTKAIYKFMLGRMGEVTTLLFKAVSFPTAAGVFKNLARDMHRFGWERNMPGRNVIEELCKAVSIASNEGDSEVRSDCLKILNDLLSKNENAPSESSEFPLNPTSSPTVQRPPLGTASIPKGLNNLGNTMRNDGVERRERSSSVMSSARNESRSTIRSRGRGPRGSTRGRGSSLSLSLDYLEHQNASQPDIALSGGGESGLKIRGRGGRGSYRGRGNSRGQDPGEMQLSGEDSAVRRGRGGRGGNRSRGNNRGGSGRGRGGHSGPGGNVGI